MSLQVFQEKNIEMDTVNNSNSNDLNDQLKEPSHIASSLSLETSTETEFLGLGEDFDKILREVSEIAYHLQQEEVDDGLTQNLDEIQSTFNLEKDDLTGFTYNESITLENISPNSEQLFTVANTQETSAFTTVDESLVVLNNLNPTLIKENYQIPEEAKILSFDFQVLDESIDDFLEIRLFDQSLEQISIIDVEPLEPLKLIKGIEPEELSFSSVDENFRSLAFLLPENISSDTNYQLTFEIKDNNEDFPLIDSVVAIKNLGFGKGLTGKSGDITTLDFASIYGDASQYVNLISPVSEWSEAGQIFVETDSGLTPLTSVDTTFEETFSNNGIFHFAPEILLDSNNNQQSFQGELFGSVKLKQSDTDEGITRWFRLKIEDGFSTEGEEVVTFGRQPLDIGRQEQRLRYLGFFGSDGNQLTVNGVIDTNTEWAIGLFNAAVANTQHSPSSNINTFINEENAPQWREFPTGGDGWTNSDTVEDNQDWGTSWAIEVLNAAGAANKANKGTNLASNDISLKRGGVTPDHSTHEAGMDIDIETPSTDRINTPFYKTHSINGVKYIAAANTEDANGNTIENIIRLNPNTNTYFASPITGSLDNAIEHNTNNYNNEQLLRGISKLIISPNGYDIENVKRNIEAFTNITTSSGASVKSILYNDPRTWDIGGGKFVKFEHGHGGHFHVDVLPPHPASLSPEYTFTGKTGDVIEVNLKEALGNEFTSFNLSGRDYLEQGGTVILDANFASNGILYFAPDIENAIAFLDEDNNNLGFQGEVIGQVLVNDGNGEQLKLFKIDVQPGYSLDKDVMTGSDNQVNLKQEKARIQQRLRYLGFVDYEGKPLGVDGVFGNRSDSAIKRFKAAIDPNLTDPDNENSDLDDNTLDWLNRQDAPQWQQLIDDSNDFDLRDGGNFFGTNWVIDTIKAATNSHPGTQVIYNIASQTGDSNNQLGDTGNRFEIQIDSSLATESDGDELNDEEKNIVDLLEEIWNASSQGTVKNIIHSNSKIIDAFNERIDQDIATENDSYNNRFRVELNPPVETPLEAEEVNILTNGLNNLSDIFDELNNTNIFSESLPFLGTLPDNDELDLNLGNALDFGTILREDFLTPLGDYFILDETPTVNELTALIRGLNAPDSASEDEGTSDVSPNSFKIANVVDPNRPEGLFVDPLSIRQEITEEEISYSFKLQGKRILENVNLDFSQVENDWQLNFDGNTAIDFVVNTDLDFTFGYERRQDLTKEQAFFVKIDNFKIGGGVEINDFDAELNVGFLNSNVVDGSLNLITDVDVIFNNPDQDVENKITLAEIFGTELEELISFEQPSFLVDTVLPIQVDLLGFETNANITVAGDLFGPEKLDFDLESTFSDDLRNFTQLSPLQIVNAFVQFGNWLQSNGYQNLLDKEIPFLEGRNFADLLDFATTLQTDVFDKFVDEDENPLFSNLADFVDLLSEVLGEELGDINARYNRNTNILSFDFSHLKTFAEETSSLDFDLDLGVIAELDSNSNLNYSVQGKTDFTIGFDLSPYNASLTGETALPLDGKLSDEAIFIVSANGTTPIEIKVSSDQSNSNRNHLIEDINIALQNAELDDVEASLVGDKITLSTNGNLSGASLLILEVNDIAANELGLQEIGTSDNLGDRTIFSDINLTGSANLIADDIDAEGRLTLIEFSIVDGSLTGNVEAKLEINNPDSSNRPITLTELFNNVANLDNFTNVSFSGAAALDFPTIEVTDSIVGVVNEDLSANYTWSNVFEAGTITETVSSAFEQLSRYAEISVDKIIESLSSLAEFFDSLDNGLLGNQLPLLDVNFSDLAGLGSTIRTAIQDIENDPDQARVLSAIEDKLETAIAQAIGISPDENIVVLSLAETDLQFNLNYDYSKAISEDLTIDLRGLGISPLTELIDVRGGTKLNGELTTDANLIFGFDLGINSIPRPYLHENTTIEIGLQALADEIEFSAALGPLGIFIQDYEQKEAIASIGLGNDPTQLEPATVTLSLQDIANDKYYLDTLNFSSVQVETIGQAQALLPVFYPLESEYQGDIEFSADLSNGQINLTNPDFENFIDSLDVENQIGAIIDGLDQLLTQLQSLLSSDVFANIFPFIGDQLKDSATFIEELRANLTTKLDQAIATAPEKSAEIVREALFDALGPTGLNILDKNFHDDQEGNTIATLDDIRVIVEKDSSNIAENVLYEMKIIDDFYTLSQEIGFDIGLPGLNLSVEDSSSIDINLGYEFQLGFGISRQQGVYLTTDVEDELLINLEASIPDLEAVGNLGFLEVKITDEDGDQNPDNDGINVDGDEYDPSSFIGQFKVDIVDPGNNDNRLTFSELSSGLFSGSFLDAEVTGEADINLDLETSFNGNDTLPRLFTDLHIDWLFDPSQPDYDSILGNLPTFNFGNIYLDVGTFLNDFISPIVDNIRSVLEPVDELIETLTTPIPIISDVLGDTTLLDLARYFGYERTADFIEAATILVDLVDNFDVVSDNTLIDLGKFSFDDLFTVEKFDVRGKSNNQGTGNTNIGIGGQNLGNINDLPNLLLDSLVEEAEAAALNPTQQFEQSAPNFNSYADLIPGEGFIFPLLDNPKQAINLLFGRDVVLFEYDTPTLSLGFSYGQELNLGGLTGLPLTAYIGGGANLTADFNFGFDTHGLRQYVETGNSSALFDGFYVVDKHRVEGEGETSTIVDLPELVLNGGLFGGVDLDVITIVIYGIPVGSISVGGAADIGLNIEMDISDPNSDQRVRLTEIAENARQGLLCIFDTEGEIYAQLDAVLKVKIGKDPFSKTIYKKKFKISRETLLDFDHTCGPPPVLAELDPDTGVLTLNMGDRAHLREIGNLSDGNENFTVSSFGADGVVVEAFGHQLVYGGFDEELERVVEVTKIVADGGLGNDTITIENDVDPNIEVELRGGVGNDSLIGGRGNDFLEGGTGNDTILGRRGNDRLFGQQGEDEIFGGEGNDHIEGGSETDDLYGEQGEDEIYGQQGQDYLWGGVDADSLFGGLGNDVLHGEAGQDQLFGNEGDDSLYGGDDADSLEGNEDSDYLFGDGADDVLYGHSSSGVGDDGARDFLYGDYGLGSGLANAPQIRQAGGNDQLFGQSGDDYLQGDEENDSLYGGSGNDELQGNDGEDMLYGNTGDDSLFGGLDRDILYGQEDDDLLIGNEANDSLYGGLGNDELQGNDGEDILHGNAGNDSLLGGLDNDFLYGDEDDDLLHGSEGNDFLYGGSGNDNLSGDRGDDVLDGDGDNDSLYGGLGQDRLYAGLGDDVLEGQTGDDSLYGEFGNNQLYGDAGEDLLVGGVGIDTILGGIDNDYLSAGGGVGNQLQGEAGDDTLIGSDDGGEDDNFDDNLYFGDILDGGAGQDRIFGLGGADLIRGGDDADILDGGDNGDRILGGAGNDLLYGGGGNNNHLDGQQGDDTLHGSEDGRDVLSGGVGRDRLYGYGGNDHLQGGDQDDTLDGGFGDDLLEGDAGSDVILGGANHDRLYGHNQAEINDDNAVDYLYGDFGTNGDETDAGDDQLWGQGGNDYLFGEGGNDLIPEFAEDDWVDYGNGLNGPAEPFTTPTPTPSPTLGNDFNIHAEATLPTQPSNNSRWGDLNGSAEGLGLSGDVGVSIEPTIVAGSNGQYVAWTDSRNGNYEVYLAYYDGENWQPLNSSSEQGGISNTVDQSRRPSLTLDNTGSPVIAWTELSGDNSNIHVARYDQNTDNWLQWGSVSQTGTADHAQIINTDNGTVVAWLDSSTGTTQVYAQRFEGNQWVDIGVDSATGNGISLSSNDVKDLTITSDGTKVAIAWMENSNGIEQVKVKEYAGGVWTELIGFATVQDSASPSLTYHNGQLFLAREQIFEVSQPGQSHSDIYVARYSGSQWLEDKVSDTLGRSFAPQILSQGGKLHLVWADEGTIDKPVATVALYSKVWNGAEFIEELPGDASYRGISLTGGQVRSLDLGVDEQGNPFVAWSEDSSGSPEIYVRGNTVDVNNVYQADDTTSIQGILDNNDLGDGDVIVIAPGTTITEDIIFAAEDAGVTLLGAADQSTVIAGSVTIDGVDEITLQRLTFNHEVTLTNSRNLNIVDNQFTGVNGLKIDGNLNDGVSGYIAHNAIATSGTGITINTAFEGQITENEISGGTVGIAYNAPAYLNHNRIYDNQTGVVVTVAQQNGFGFVGEAARNEIFNNQIGVQLTEGQVQNQHIYNNVTSVVGTGILGGNSFDQANLIEGHDIGVSQGFDGTIQFNRIANNTIGIEANNDQHILHNLIYRNGDIGVHISDTSDVQIVNNTFYAPTGDNIRLENNGREVEVRNNILWAERGYNLYIANDSQSGFFSDYNLLHTTGTGKIGYWTKDFTDILDWQADIARFDLHSLGTTVINPHWSEPRFLNRDQDDYRLLPQTAGLRFTNPAVDLGDSRTDLGTPPTQVNLLSNPSFESGTAHWTVNQPDGTVKSESPSAFLGNNYFTAGNVEEGFAQQIVDLVAQGYDVSQLDSGELDVIFGGRIRTLERDRGRLILTFLDENEEIISFIDPLGEEVNQITVNAANRPTAWELIGDRLSLPTGTRKLIYEFRSDRDQGNSNDSFLDGAFLQLVSAQIAPDVGAYGNLTTDVANLEVQPHIALRFPELYTDWEIDKPQIIRWETFNNPTNSPIRIDLYQDGVNSPELLTTLAAGTPDDGQYIWIPSNSDIDFGTYGLRIQVSLVDNPAIFDRSTEPFSTPEDGNQYFVDDNSNTDDESTPNAIGNNRHTGKIATAPKPNPVNLFRIYDVSADDVVNIDTGDYPLIVPLTLSGSQNRGLGLDDGFTFTGPGDPNLEVNLFPAIPGDRPSALIELIDADFVTLSNLTLRDAQRGLWVHSGSDNFDANYITAYGHTSDGIFIETNSPFSNLDGLVSYDNNQYGIYINGIIASLTNSIAYNNNIGIYANNTNSDRRTIIGTEDLSLGNGNIVYNNRNTGIYATSNVLVRGNVSYGHQGNNDEGIYLQFSASAVDNIVHNNRAGITGNTRGDVVSNRVYNNIIGLDISTSYGDLNLSKNVVYSNDFGINIRGRGTYLNNLVYDNNNRGILVTGGNIELANNTIYQLEGDGIVVENRSGNVDLRNNIVVVDRGYAINVSNDSQQNFQSDYNLVYVLGTGSVGFWQEEERKSLVDWRNATFTDRESIFANPIFVDVDGNDDILGYESADNDGRDDDFHLQSLYGSFHQGSFAPVIDLETGKPIFLTPIETLDSQQSPAIDRGDENSNFYQELEDNGGYINLGVYGNTEQASKSPPQYVLITHPNEGENIPQESSYEITWRSDGFSGNVLIEYSEDGGTSFQTLADEELNDGSYLWEVNPEIHNLSQQYLIRIRAINEQTISDVTDNLFTITEPINAYYINDTVLVGDEYTTAIGNNNNDGLTPATPMASIRAVLEKYELEAGDTIYVDTGNYNLTRNIVLDESLSGITIIGAIGVENQSILNRGNTATGSYVFELTGADEVTLESLVITGGQYGIYASNTADSDQITIRNNEIFSNAQDGIYILSGNELALIEGNEVYNNNDDGIDLRS
ncbi:right-handed parallel beta-helix repeat-containing protein, partial [Crocosphaera sp.]|uniref:right-handed parallel beta-helix repeat-containing protein n=1 Tax=Crocosphaera sp. TaxID=2729996 RepID=UPI003F285B85